VHSITLFLSANDIRYKLTFVIVQSAVNGKVKQKENSSKSKLFVAFAQLFHTGL